MEKEVKRKRKSSASNKAFHIFNAIFWIIVMFIILYPLYLVVIASISNPDAIYRGEVIWRPIEFSIRGYKAVFAYKELISSYGNSIFYTVTSVIISIWVTMSAGYALSRPTFPGKKIFNFMFIFTMFFGGGLIPTFLVMRDLGLYNTRAIMILMGCVSVWNVMVARTYIQNSIPHELYEAAVLDGASHFDYFFKCVIPLSKSIIAVLVVYYGVSKWNDYFTGLVYLKGRELLPLQTVLREILATLQLDKSGDYMMSVTENAASLTEAMRTANVAKYCIIVIATGPVVLLYALLQKYFEKGVMIGSLKG